MKKEVCEIFINKFTKPNDIVLDPFMGCGTTALVCKESGRNYLGFELCEEYINIAQKRLNKNNNSENISIEEILQKLREG